MRINDGIKLFSGTCTGKGAKAREKETDRRALAIQLVLPQLRTNAPEHSVQEKEDFPIEVYPILLHVPERL